MTTVRDLFFGRADNIGWLREYGVLWFRVKTIGTEGFHAKLLVPTWHSDNGAQSTRAVFEDPFALQKAVLHDTSWWAHVEYVTEGDAPPVFIRYDQIGWVVEQPWIADRMKDS